jgi:hypothetical protein
MQASLRVVFTIVLNVQSLLDVEHFQPEQE